MNVWTDSERNGLWNPNQTPKLKKNIYIINICPIMRFTTLIPIEANKLFSCSQSVQCK